MNLPARGLKFRRVSSGGASKLVPPQALASFCRLQAPRLHLEFYLRGYVCRIASIAGSVKGEVDGKPVAAGFDQAQIALHLIRTVRSMPLARDGAGLCGDQQPVHNAVNGAA